MRLVGEMLYVLNFGFLTNDVKESIIIGYEICFVKAFGSVQIRKSSI
jgi:hypothetical protein